MRDVIGQPALPAALPEPSQSALFRSGFLTMLPLWTGAIPVGIAYGIAARAAGLSLVETQLMSLTVFSAAAQISAVSLLDAGAPAILLIATALALNAQLLILGLATARQHRLSWPQRLVTAHFLTDAAFGIAAAQGASARGPLRLPVLLGAGVSMFAGWNIGTALGAAAGHALPDPRALGIDFVVTLAFLAVLIPLIRTRTTILVALTAAATTLLLTHIGAGAFAVLAAGLSGCAAGAWAAGHAETGPHPRPPVAFAPSRRSRRGEPEQSSAAKLKAPPLQRSWRGGRGVRFRFRPPPPASSLPTPHSPPPDERSEP